MQRAHDSQGDQLFFLKRSAIRIPMLLQGAGNGDVAAVIRIRHRILQVAVVVRRWSRQNRKVAFRSEL